MQNWWVIWQFSNMKQREILRKAEMFRLLQEDGTHRGEPYWRCRILLNKLGQLLVSWGLFLQNRYGATPS
jgi:hypothetical protein